MWRPDPAGTGTPLRRTYAGRWYHPVCTLNINTYAGRCNIMSLFVMTKYLYYFVLECIIPHISALWSLYCIILMLSVHTWWYHRPAYVRRSSVSVSGGLGRYNILRVFAILFCIVKILIDFNLSSSFCFSSYLFSWSSKYFVRSKLSSSWYYNSCSCFLWDKE